MAGLVSKSDQVRELVRSSDFVAALRIAKSFRLGLTAEQRAILARAHEARLWGDTMRQMGRDPEAAFRQGVDLLSQLYGGEKSCN